MIPKNLRIPILAILIILGVSDLIQKKYFVGVSTLCLTLILGAVYLANYRNEKEKGKDLQQKEH